MFFCVTDSVTAAFEEKLLMIHKTVRETTGNSVFIIGSSGEKIEALPLVCVVWLNWMLLPQFSVSLLRVEAF